MRTVALVVNPTKVHQLDRLVASVERACQARGYAVPEVLETTPEDAGEGLARDAAARDVSLVLAAGGDGTVQAVCTGLDGTATTLGILPLGTGNLLARNLELPLELDDALEVALTGRDRRIDLGRASVGGSFAVMAGVGFDAQMMADAPEGLKSWLGWPAYVVSGLRHLRDKAVSFEIVLDGGEPVRVTGRGVVIGNVGELQGGLALLPDAVCDDGVLDVVALTPERLVDWARMLVRLMGRSGLGDDTLCRWTARRVEVRMASPIEAQLDGEPVGAVRSLVAEVAAEALAVRVSR